MKKHTNGNFKTATGHDSLKEMTPQCRNRIQTKSIMRQLLPFAEEKGRKCKDDRSVFTFHGADATPTKCALECERLDDCYYYSAIYGNWCTGCNGDGFNTLHEGSEAYVRADVKCPVDVDHGMDGGDITMPPADHEAIGSRIEDCVSWCAKRPDCVGIVFNRLDAYKKCYPKRTWDTGLRVQNVHLDSVQMTDGCRTVAKLYLPRYMLHMVGPASATGPMSINCPAGMRVVGGGCKVDSGVLEESWPFGDDDGLNGGWQCGGTASKRVWALCSSSMSVHLVEGTTSEDTGSVACPSGSEPTTDPYRNFKQLIGGGCQPNAAPTQIKYSGPVDDTMNAWQCTSAGVAKTIRALCTEPHVPIQRTPWADIAAAKGEATCPSSGDHDFILGGGCDARVGTPALLGSAPEIGSADAYAPQEFSCEVATG
ncbi:unnamed protein product, partial [Amoebophrya sp. A25]